MSRRWNPDLSLHGRIGVALAAAGALLLAVVGLSTVLLLQTRDTQSEVVGEYYSALRTSQDYFVGMLDAETAVRGYVITKDESTLDPLTTSKQPWANPISDDVEDKLPGDHAAAVTDLRRVEGDSAAWYAQWAAPTIAKVRNGGDVDAADVEDGKRLFDTFRTDYSQYIDGLRAERQGTAQHLSNLTSWLFEASLLAALVAVLTAVILWWLLRRWVSRPVTALAHETQVVSDGDLSHQVRVSGPHEFISLAQDVDAMRERLVRQIAAIESARVQVAEGQEQLEEQADELQRSNKELEQFAYVASHDLQEPLRKVASFCQLLERRYSEQLDDRGKQYIHFAVDGARRMQQLINDLLEFSRVGRLSTMPAGDVDTGACLRAALANVETSRTETGATIDVQTEMPVVRGEAPLITQLFQNLLSNAIKFRADAPPVIKVGCIRTGENFEFWCSDNGIGIPAEYADRVFLIFQRLHPKEVYEGTGIGLAMCKKIVEYHGGRIWVEGATDAAADAAVDGVDGGQPHPGATIRWTLPAQVAVTDEPAPVTASAR